MEIDIKLKDKVVVVTGSTRGIGRAIARSCAQEEARAVICSRKEPAVQETCQAFQKEGFEVSGIKADVAVTADLIKLFKHSLEIWRKIDIWINNAGLSAGMRFFNDIKVSPKLTKDLQNLPYALEAFGVPSEEVGKLCVEITAQDPGKVTGKTYSLLCGKRLMRGIALMIWYRLSGKMK